jgi:anti-sigma B factor antagonist
MTLQVEEAAGDVAMVILSGRLDFASAQALDGPLNAMAEQRQSIVIDLSKVEFMASLGLRTLIKCAKTMNRRQGRLALFSPRPVVAEIIQISGIEDMIPVFQSEDEAVAAVSLI